MAEFTRRASLGDQSPRAGLWLAATPPSPIDAQRLRLAVGRCDDLQTFYPDYFVYVPVG